MTQNFKPVNRRCPGAFGLHRKTPGIARAVAMWQTITEVENIEYLGYGKEFIPDWVYLVLAKNHMASNGFRRVKLVRV